MKKLNNTTLVRVAAAALLVTVAACSKKDAAVADTSPAAITPAPEPAAALRVSSIETGTGLNADRTLKDNTDDFGVRDTIYVSVKTEGTGSGKLSAKFTFQDGQTVEEASQDIAPTGDAYSEFHIQKGTAWPKGNYKVEVMLNGVSAGSKDFEIK